MKNSIEPLISIVLPVYNTGAMLKETVDSALTQTLSNFELIIIDDGSKKETSDIAKSYTDPRIRYYYQDNQGMAVARNRGIELATGKYIAFLDHDDIWLPEKLERQVEVFHKYPETSLVYSQIIYFDEEGNEREQNEPILNGYVFSQLLMSCLIKSASCVMFHSSVFANPSYRFRTECVPCDDYDLWLYIAMTGSIRCTNEVLVRYRVHQNNTSNDKTLMFEAKMKLLKLLFKRINDAEFSSWRKFKLRLMLKRTISYLYREETYILLNQSLAKVALQNSMQAMYYAWFNPKSPLVFMKALFLFLRKRDS